ncbi:MAG: hypothetical protein FWE45_02750 [Firmicutes bacterium]|nr:hypothetical protein [Bacillota bacterium]
MKQSEILNGIILSADKHKEFDLRFIVLSQDRLKITYATGILRPTAKLRGALQLFNECELSMIGSKIMGAHIIQNNVKLTKEIHRFYLANSIADILTKTLRGGSEDGIYKLVSDTFKILAQTDISIYKIYIAFYSKLLSILGYGVEEFEYSDKIDEFMFTEDVDSVELGLGIANKCVDAIKRAYYENLDVVIEMIF